MDPSIFEATSANFFRLSAVFFLGKGDWVILNIMAQP